MNSNNKLPPPGAVALCVGMVVSVKSRAAMRPALVGYVDPARVLVYIRLLFALQPKHVFRCREVRDEVVIATVHRIIQSGREVRDEIVIATVVLWVSPVGAIRVGTRTGLVKSTFNGRTDMHRGCRSCTRNLRHHKKNDCVWPEADPSTLYARGESSKPT